MGDKETKTRNLLEKLKVEKDEAEILRNVLNKMSEDELDVLSRFLFPDMSEPDPKIDEKIKELKEKRKGRFKVEREGNEVTIEIL